MCIWIIMIFFLLYQLALLLDLYFCSGCVPLDPQLTRCVEEGQDFVKAYPTSVSASSITSIVETVLQTT